VFSDQLFSCFLWYFEPTCNYGAGCLRRPAAGVQLSGHHRVRAPQFVACSPASTTDGSGPHAKAGGLARRGPKATALPTLCFPSEFPIYFPQEKKTCESSTVGDSCYGLVALIACARMVGACTREQSGSRSGWERRWAVNMWLAEVGRDLSLDLKFQLNFSHKLLIYFRNRFYYSVI